MPVNGTRTLFEVNTNIDKSTKKTGNHWASSQHYKDSFRLIDLDLSTFYEDKLRLIFLCKEK